MTMSGTKRKPGPYGVSGVDQPPPPRLAWRFPGRWWQPVIDWLNRFFR